MVGTDGSARADKAVMWAAKHASQRTVPIPLAIIYAIPENPNPSAAVQEARADDAGRWDSKRVVGETVVNGAADRVRLAYPDLQVEPLVVRGHPAEVLARAGADADQVIVGSRGLGSRGLFNILGSSTDHIVANAQGTVAVVPEHIEDRLDGPVVLGLDDSEPGSIATGRAFQAASLRGVPLTVIHAAEGRSADTTRKEAERLIKDKVAAFPDVQVTIETPSGRPENAIIEASKTAGLVVIGSMGRGGFTGLRLGSTTRHVLHESRCPVVVTRSLAGWADQIGRPVSAAH